MVVKLARINRLWLFAALALTSLSAVASIDVRVDRNPVQEDESFTIEFSTNNDVSTDPDFSSLARDFKILRFQPVQNFQLINGVMSKHFSWTLTLAPLHTGKIEIPSIAIGNETTERLELEVVPAAKVRGGGDLFVIQVDSDVNTTYVQGQILVTLKLFFGTSNIMNPRLGDLTLSDKNAVVEKFDNEAEYSKRLGAKVYRVVERKYAVFAQKPGMLTINPVEFETSYIDSRSALHFKKVKSKPIQVLIKPIPSQIGAADWIPASDLKLEESWIPAQVNFVEGESVTRTIRITAVGVASSALPKISMGDLSFARLYPDQPELSNDIGANGIIGTRIEKIGLLPQQPGKYTLPAIEIPWWNTKKHRREVARIKARTINIKAASGKKPNRNSLANISDSAASEAVQKLPAAMQQPSPALRDNVWFYISIVFCLFWLLTLLAWFNSARYVKTATASGRRQVSGQQRRQTEKEIEQAIAKGDLHEVKRLLIKWSVAVWGEKAPRSVGGMRKRAEGALADELEYLNNLLYADDQPRYWDGKGLCLALKNYPIVRGDHSEQGLKPLFHQI